MQPTCDTTIDYSHPLTQPAPPVDPRYPHYPQKPHPAMNGDRRLQDMVVRVSIDEESGQQVAIFSPYR